LVFGTRPEAIKLAPVAAALFARGISCRLVLTGQHPLPDLTAFAFPPALPVTSLRCSPGADPQRYAQELGARLEPLLPEFRLVLVQGDTASALGGALAAERAGLPLAHVEAGLRSHDRRAPWPEEEFRMAIDARSDLLFAPSALAAANLRRERCAGLVLVTGNSGVEAALRRVTPQQARVREPGRPTLLVTCHRRESWGEGLASIAAALRALAHAGDARIRLILHPNAAVAASMRAHLAHTEGVTLEPPVDHAAMLRAMTECDLLVSDSGGVQEEAPLLGVPLLVLRNRSERPEAIASGNVRLVGTDTDRIVKTVRGLLSDPAALERMSRPALPFGDGGASALIAAASADWIGIARETRAA
jgi:UDP-N-acetylglucosamine 2-epimerase (non-hydrolysing)